MTHYIDVEKLTKAIEEKGLDCSFALKMERLDTLALIDSLQQEQPEEINDDEKIMNFFDALGDCGFSQHDILLLKNIWKEAGCPTPKSQVADASKMEREVDYSEFEKAITKYRPQSGSQEIMTRAEEAALKAYPKNKPDHFGIYSLEYSNILSGRKGYQEGYEQAEKDIISIIESRLSELMGDAQPTPTLRAELRDLICKIKEK